MSDSAGSAPSPFLPSNPYHQWAWDSTSAKCAKACPRQYYYAIVLGWVTTVRRIELDFGIAGHLVLECYHRSLFATRDLAEALRSTVAFTLRTFRDWTSEEDPLRSRDSLLRLAIAWAEDQRDDPLETLPDAFGGPALEEHFLLPLPKDAAPGRPYVWGGHRDRRVWDGTGTAQEDWKTTTATLSPGYFRRFTPDLQMTGYYAAGRAEIPGFTKIVVTAIQVAKGFIRFERSELYRVPEHVAEWWSGISAMFDEVAGYAERANAAALAGAPAEALEAAFPLREESCFRCPFRTVCSEPPRLREGVLRTNYVQRPWNPLIPRTARRLEKPWEGRESA